MQNAVQRLRLVIDNIDSLLIKLLNKRFKTSLNIQKLKNDGLGFSPSRERQILAKCSSGELKDTYLSVLSNSRRIPDGIKWYFIESGDRPRRAVVRQYLTKIFGVGCLSGLKIIKNNEAPKPKRNEKYIVISSDNFATDSGALSGADAIYKYCEYRLDGEMIFSFYSNIKPAFDNDLNVVINL
jgi:chorismate mutase